MSLTSAVTLATLATTLLLSSVAAQSAVADAQLLQPLDATTQLPLPVLPDGWLDVQNVSTSGDTIRSPSLSDADMDVLPVPPYNGSLMVRHRRELGDMGGWQDGRCTWYGGPGGPGPDGMNIFTGSCGYGTKLKAPYFVAAAQTMGGYDWGLTGDCGKCFEVMCVDGRTRGTSQSQLGPWEGCQESGKRSVVIMISDSCPCNHPNPSNKKVRHLFLLALYQYTLVDQAFSAC